MLKKLLLSVSLILAVPTLAVDLTLIKQADTLIQKGEYTRVDAMLVYQNNQLIAEHYYGKFDENFQHRTHSTFKGITALLTLIAIEKKLLSADELVVPLLERYAKPENKDPRREQIRVSHLLDMTSGLDCDEAPTGEGPSHEWGVDEGPKPVNFALNIPMAREPGAEWHYCSANSFLLAASISAALERAESVNIFQFAQKNLFTPLGIEQGGYRLRYSPDGQFLMGQGNSNFRPKDLAKFGLLILNRGQWQGKKILQESSIAQLLKAEDTINWSWVDQLKTHPPVKTRYHYQWYQTAFNISEREVDTVHSWGNGGQFIFVIPELDAVVVFNGSNQGNRRIKLQKQPFDIMHRFVLPALLAG